MSEANKNVGTLDTPEQKKKKLSPLNNDGIIKKKKIVDAKRILDSSHDGLGN